MEAIGSALAALSPFAVGMVWYGKGGLLDEVKSYPDYLFANCA